MVPALILLATGAPHNKKAPEKVGTIDTFKGRDGHAEVVKKTKDVDTDGAELLSPETGGL